MDKKISELDQALQINNDAVFPFSQDNSGEDTTYKASITQLGTEIGEGMTFSNLQTSSKKLVGAINEIAQGGGGGGGHTILDDEGTSLTQRTNLQFKGAYSEDNSTDDTTEVNVVREMTKAEFDLLSDDEKTGFINITDITGGTDDRFQPVIYSEDEREIGVWTDGKPLYEKTFVLQSTIAFNQNTWISTTIDASSIETVVDCVLMYKSAGYPPTFAKIEDGFVQVYNGANVLFRFDTVILRYTKTTDVAGSGQWTPQGVPAVHYSEDEKVIGTWIDGSTIYEKVFVLNTELQVSSSGWTSTNISIDYVSAILGIEMFGTTNYQGGGLANIENNILRLQTTRNSTAYVKSFVLRYTKST